MWKMLQVPAYILSGVLTRGIKLHALTNKENVTNEENVTSPCVYTLRGAYKGLKV